MEEYTSEEEKTKAPKTSQKLHEKFRNLEKYYEVFTRSSSLSFKNKHNITHSNIKQLGLLLGSTPNNNNNSEVWKVRTNELAKEESRRDRKLDFENGKLRGRRLFEEENDEEVETYYVSAGLLLPEVINVEKGKLSSCLAVKYDFNKQENDVIRVYGNRLIRVRKSMILILFVVLGLMSCILGVFVVGLFGGCSRGNHAILFPT